MYLLAGALPGVPVREVVAVELLKNLAEISEQHTVLFDGFPSVPAHVELLPADSKVVVLELEESVRNERLVRRSETSKRKWTPGLGSERDMRLPLVVQALGSRCKRIDANYSVETVAIAIATAIT